MLLFVVVDGFVVVYAVVVFSSVLEHNHIHMHRFTFECIVLKDVSGIEVGWWSNVVGWLVIVVGWWVNVVGWWVLWLVGGVMWLVGGVMWLVGG